MPMISEATPVVHADPLPDAVDVAVIGAGIIGTATSWFLAQRGAKVALIEKGRVAGEQSSRNWGWVRQQGRDRDELPIMMESNRIWRSLAKHTGEKDLTFTGAGLVYLAENQQGLDRFEAWHDLAREHQLDTRMLSPEEAREAAPGVEGHWIGGMLTPSDGRAWEDRTCATRVLRGSRYFRKKGKPAHRHDEYSSSAATFRLARSLP